jgi:phosphotransferase system HPr-like phosphotransfer protein
MHSRNLILAYLSARELADKTNTPINTIRSALKRGCLKGIKTSDGTWLIDEKDADEYFKAPTSPEWISFQNLSVFFCIPIDKLFHLRDQCDFETKNFKGEIFVRTNEIYPNLVATGFIRQYEGDIYYRKTACFSGSFKVQNKKGIHLRPAVYICSIAKTYYPQTRLELVYDKTAWNFQPTGILNDLILLRVPNCGTVKINTWGILKESLTKDLILASKNRFYL